MKMNGFDKLSKELSRLEKNAENLSKKESVTFSELFNRKFLSKHSSFTSFDDLAEKSPFTINNEEDFKAIPDDEWEKFITESTDFSSWDDMQSEAHTAWIEHNLFS